MIPMATREESKNIRSAIFLIILAILAILFLYFIGIPLVGKFTSYLGDLRNINGSVNDTTPPAPPKFNNFPDFTNQRKIDLTGTAEVGVTVKLNFNGKESENLTDKKGNFLFSVDLNDNANSFYAIATDQSGNVSQKTNIFSISFDDIPPELNIIKPTENENMFGSQARQITIQGKTDIDSTVTINDRFVTVESDGSFAYTLTMSDGANVYNIKSADLAGNTNEKKLTVNFTP